MRRASQAPSPASRNTPPHVHPTTSGQAPREHGFWVMLALSVLSALLANPTWGTALWSSLLAAAATLAAARVGKRIRKNPPLQVLAALGLGGLAGSAAWLGGGKSDAALHLGFGLATAFATGACVVTGVLERARRHPWQARAWGLLSLVLPSTGASVLYAAASVKAACALGLTLFYSLAVLLIAPSARRLKTLGWTLALTHALTGYLLAA